VAAQIEHYPIEQKRLDVEIHRPAVATTDRLFQRLPDVNAVIAELHGSDQGRSFSMASN
jgi:hypothetical protein